MKNLLLSLWLYRQFVLSSIKNELLSRFVRSKLGGLWIILNPLSQVLIYALILSNIMVAKLPGIDHKYAYAIYLMAGLLGWTLFNDIVSRSLNLFIAQGNLMKKMSFPRITLPSILVGTALLDNILLLLAILVIFALLGHSFSMQMLWLIPLTLITVTLSIGFGMILGIMNVFLRDIGQVVTIMMQLWFWLTPIVYTISIIPEKYHYLLNLNPIYPLINSYHHILVYSKAPDFGSLLFIAGLALLMLILGMFMFYRASEEMVDVL